MNSNNLKFKTKNDPVDGNSHDDAQSRIKQHIFLQNKVAKESVMNGLV
jgi:hypothetical protein